MPPLVTTRATLSVRLPSGRFPRKSLVKVLTEARQRAVADVEKAFRDEADPQTGRPWPARKADPRRPGPFHPLIQLTGRLKREAVRAAQQATVSGSTLTVRQSRPGYARYHAYGTVRIPRRRWLAVSPNTRRFVARRLKGEGLRIFRGSR